MQACTETVGEYVYMWISHGLEVTILSTRQTRVINSLCLQCNSVMTSGIFPLGPFNI